MISKRLGPLSPYKTETTPSRIKLSSNELAIDFPEEVRRRIAEEVSKIPFNRYPDPEARALREAIAQRFSIKEENILLGNGSDELIYYLSIGIGEFDRGIFYPTPTFSMYGISAQVLGRDRVEVPLREDFDIDITESLRVLREKRPSLAYFAYPNNPTGNCFSEDKIRRIREEGIFIVVDEAYYHYSGKTFLDEALRRDDTVVLRTLSKIGMAGLRVGFMVGKEEIVRELSKIRLPFNITFPSQVIATLMLTEFYHILEAEIKKVVEERQRVYEELLKLEGIKPYPSEANFILFKSLAMPAELLHKRMVEEGVLIRNFSYMIPQCLRVSIGKPEENDAFLEAIHKVLKNS